MAIRSIHALSLPPLMNMADGSALLQAAQWPARRRELIDMLSKEVYGITPPACAVSGSIALDREDDYAGKATAENIEIALDAPNGRFSFPVALVYPNAAPIRALFVHISFYGASSSSYSPCEEIIDGGFALATIDYNAVTRDDGDFSDGIAAMFPREGDSAWGKIGMWAYAASRTIDYLKGRDLFADVPVAVIGHSRLGKTALWCGAQDERVDYIVANNSGCSGAAITRDKEGERVEAITRTFPFWFCDRYARYADREHEMPFDQHFLLAACAPRRLYIGTAMQDIWADPAAEYYACLAASDAYSLLGRTGLDGPDTPPTAAARFHAGDIGFHLREGTHFLSRADWRMAMEYIAGKQD